MDNPVGPCIYLFMDLTGGYPGPLTIHPFGGFWRVPEIPLDAGVYRNVPVIHGLCHLRRVPETGTGRVLNSTFPLG